MKISSINKNIIFRFRLEREVSAVNLLDRTGRTLRTEPLVTIKQLEKFLLRAVARQWHDLERETFHYLKVLTKQAPMMFTYKVTKSHIVIYIEELKMILSK